MDSGSERQKFCVREISVTLGTSTSPVPSLSFSHVLETGKEEPTAESKRGEKDAHERWSYNPLRGDWSSPVIANTCRLGAVTEILIIRGCYTY